MLRQSNSCKHIRKVVPIYSRNILPKGKRKYNNSEGGEKKVAIAGKISIEVKIRDIDRLEETAEKCFAVAKVHPYAVDINIRVDETSLLCRLQRILRHIQRRLRHHLQKKQENQM